MRTFYFAVNGADGWYARYKSRDSRENTSVEHMGVNDIRAEPMEIREKPADPREVEASPSHTQGNYRHTSGSQFVYKRGGLEHGYHTYGAATGSQRDRKLHHDSFSAARGEA
jgi:hypothetical protein